MKHNTIKDNKYLVWGITAFLVICGALLATYLIFNFKAVSAGFSSLLRILTPVIDGIVLAYLLTPILNFVESKWIGWIFKKLNIEMTYKTRKLRRSISIFVTLILVICVLGVFFRIVIPQLIISIQSIIFQFPVYINNLEKFVTDILDNNPNLESTVDSLFATYSTQVTDYIEEGVLPQINTLIKTMSIGVINFLKWTFNLLIGFIISVYLMSSKELLAGQSKKIVYAWYDSKEANKIISGIRYTHQTFIGFVGGKIIDSIIIGILTFIVTSIVGTPYAVLVSVIVGVTNIIPFFGPYIGAIPSALLILMVNPLQCLYFIICILIIQQIDGNIIGPKILGDSTGLSSFWVIFAITFFGGLLGVAGMILGVPTFAVIYALFRYKINRKLRHKGMPQDTTLYVNVGSVEKDGSFMEYVPIKGRSILEVLGIKKTQTIKREIIIDDDSEIPTNDAEDILIENNSSDEI